MRHPGDSRSVQEGQGLKKSDPETMNLESTKVDQSLSCHLEMPLRQLWTTARETQARWNTELTRVIWKCLIIEHWVAFYKIMTGFG